ncbi:MAG: hypothetical protein ABIQ66_10305 [Novosphingobium sp.]
MQNSPDTIAGGRNNNFRYDHFGIGWLAISFAAMAALLVLRFFLTGYGQEFGEFDSYRTANGIINAINHGLPLSDSLLYGNQASPLYYRILTLFSAWAHRPADFAILMNTVTAVFAGGATLIIGILAREFGGRTAMVGAALAALATPLWWKVSQYAHPTFTAIFFFLCGVAIAMQIKGWQRRRCHRHADQGVAAARSGALRLGTGLPVLQLWFAR